MPPFFNVRHDLHVVILLSALSLFICVQDREIMRVLVECCLQEKVFNKYYSVLAAKLCSHDREHKTTLQVLHSIFGLISPQSYYLTAKCLGEW